LIVWVRARGEFVATVGQHAQHGQLSVDLDSVKVGSVQRGDRDRMRVDRIGLAAVTRGEHPHLCRQLRRHVQHGLTVVHETVREVSTNAVAALDRPHPLGKPPTGLDHLGIAPLIRSVLPGC
jgi:hypothetical protein